MFWVNYIYTFSLLTIYVDIPLYTGIKKEACANVLRRHSS